MTLPNPNTGLRACVVVPARDEETLIIDCLRALVGQRNIHPEEYEVLLVLDQCRDETGPLAREFALEYPSLALLFLEGPGEGAGQARRMGMETAYERLMSLERPEGLIASTDADTIVASDWLATQLEVAERGARAIGGRIHLLDAGDEVSLDVAKWRDQRGRLRHLDLLSASRQDESGIEHWQFSGASLTLTAEAYNEIGGLEPRAALEDEYLERVLRQRGIHIERPLSVQVHTSARLVGRARRGLARDLALASWTRRNTYDAHDFDHEPLRTGPRPSVSIVLPLHDGSDLTRDTLRSLRDSGLVDEVIVVRGSESAGISLHGANIYDSSQLIPEFGPARGIGDLMWRGLSVASGEIVVFADPETLDLDGRRIASLIAPFQDREDLQLVKCASGRSRAPLTELLALPMLNLHLPELAGIISPLSNEFAAHRSVLTRLPFPVGPAAGVSSLLDIARLVGIEAVAQTMVEGAVSTPPADTEAAYAVLTAITSRLPGGESIEALAPGPLFLPTPNGLESFSIAVEERPPLESLNLSARGSEDLATPHVSPG